MMISPVHWHDKEELNGTQTAIRSLQFAILALNMLYGLKFKEEIEITEESPKAKGTREEEKPTPGSE